MTLLTLIVILGVIAVLSISTVVGLATIVAMVIANLFHRGSAGIPAEAGRDGSG